MGDCIAPGCLTTSTCNQPFAFELLPPLLCSHTFTVEKKMKRGSVVRDL